MTLRGRIVFAGSPEFALPTLERLCGLGAAPVAVFTQPDRPAGRGRQLCPSPVKQKAVQLGIPVQQPVTLKSSTARHALLDLQPDLLVVVAYGLLLPPDVLAIPTRGCVNVHASLLPRWRGASPVQAAILAGDSVSGVSLMQMDAGLDTGPVYGSRSLAIGERETAGELEARLARLGAELLAEWLPALLAGRAMALPQGGGQPAYAGRIAKGDALIDWRRPAAEIDRQIRAYQPWPVAETVLEGERLRCHSGVPLFDGPTRTPPGTVRAAGATGIDVQTGDGLLRLTEVQRPGGRRMPAGEFVRGRPLTGQVLGHDSGQAAGQRPGHASEQAPDNAGRDTGTVPD